MGPFGELTLLRHGEWGHVLSHAIKAFQNVALMFENQPLPGGVSLQRYAFQLEPSFIFMPYIIH
jgi:hypothetical protein